MGTKGEQNERGCFGRGHVDGSRRYDIPRL